MVKRKVCVTNFDVAALVRELCSVVSWRLVNIYQVGDTFYLRFRGESGSRFLCLDPRRISFTRYVPSQWPTTIPIFCRFLRGRLRNSVLDGVEQIDFDRICVLRFRCGHEVLSLVVELAQRFNVVCVRSDGTVEFCLHEVVYRDRAVKRGLKYVPPPLTCNLLSLSEDEFVASLSRFSDFDIVRALVRGFGVPGEVAEEVVYLSGIDKSSTVGSISRSDLSCVYSNLVELVKRVREGSLSPRIYCDQGGSWITVVPIELKHLDECGFVAKVYDSFCDAVDEYFTKLALEVREEESCEAIREELSDLSEVIERVREDIEEYRSKEERYRRVAEYLSSRLHELYVVQDVVKRLGFGARLEDVEYELSKLGVYVSVRRFVPEKRCVVVFYPEIGEVEVPIKESPASVVSRYFDKAREFRRKWESALVRLRELERRLEELRSRLSEVREVVRSSVEYVPEIREEWFERFRWFISSDGLLVLGGKDAAQNEVLVRKYLSDRDLFFHADIHGGSVVVVKCGGTPVPESTIAEAAQFAASYSRAWSMGYRVVDVFWVLGEQVSKSAPAGEYLPRGSFMVYGKRNYVRNVELRLAIGFVRYGDSVKLTSAPPSAMRRWGVCYVVVEPGSGERSRVAKEVANFLMGSIDDVVKKMYRRVVVDRVLQLLPGNSSIVECVRC